MQCVPKGSKKSSSNSVVTYIGNAAVFGTCGISTEDHKKVIKSIIFDLL